MNTILLYAPRTSVSSRSLSRLPRLCQLSLPFAPPALLSPPLACHKLSVAPLLPLALFHAPRTSVAGRFPRASSASVAVLSLSRPTRLYYLFLPIAPPAPLLPLALFARTPPPPCFFCRSFTGSHSSVACRSLSRLPRLCRHLLTSAPPARLCLLAFFRLPPSRICCLSLTAAVAAATV